MPKAIPKSLKIGNKILPIRSHQQIGINNTNMYITIDIFCIKESFNTNIKHQLLGYKRTFVYSQH